VVSFDADGVDPMALREHAEQFSVERFRARLMDQVRAVLEGTSRV